LATTLNDALDLVRGQWKSKCSQTIHSETWIEVVEAPFCRKGSIAVNGGQSSVECCFQLVDRGKTLGLISRLHGGQGEIMGGLKLFGLEAKTVDINEKSKYEIRRDASLLCYDIPEIADRTCIPDQWQAWDSAGVRSQGGGGRPPAQFSSQTL
jgi:hypothetical protein